MTSSRGITTGYSTPTSQLTTTDAVRPLARGLLAVGLGLAACALAVTLEARSTKYSVAAGLGLGALALITIAPARRVEGALLAALALAIPFNLDVNFFYRPHVGGASALSVALADIAVLGLCGTWLYRYRLGQEPFLFRTHGAVLWPPLLFTFIGFLSLVNAEQPQLVVFELFRLGKLLLILFVVMNLRDDAQAKRFVLLLSIGVLVEAIIAALQYRYGQLLGLGILGEKALVNERIGYTVSRATGTLGHPSILGYYLELQLPLLLAFALTQQRLRARLWYLLVVVAGLLALATTLSRGAWLALPVPMALVFLALQRRRLLTLRVWVGMAAVLLAAAVALTPFYPTIERRLTHDDYKSASSRAPLNRAALSIVEQFPVLGVGLNHCAEVFHRYDKTGLARILKEKQVVHNLYLLVWVDVGTLGLLAFLGIFASCLAIAGWTFHRETRGRQAILCGVAGGLLAHLIHGLVDPGFKVSASASMLVYALLGLAGYVVASRPRGETA